MGADKNDEFFWGWEKIRYPALVWAILLVLCHNEEGGEESFVAVASRRSSRSQDAQPLFCKPKIKR
ncbi:hypothetical protein Q31b_11680 [Novipirellula aureliae]|uniref:Uncharacterized protein n=1 Tax=Novipirellula aureliae TaxID=2527966 RepID=A0A5C6EE37_9BACT|nr:hypothetical protein Q31b_11680 [Novipirellula aureliae]